MATGLVAELNESLGIQAHLIEGDKGIFDVKVNGDLVFSKFKEDRFPRLGEVSSTIKNEACCDG